MRITAKEVLEAYEKTGLKPIQCHWTKDKRTCACGLSAIGANKLGMKFLITLDSSVNEEETISKKIKLPLIYVQAFERGFDNDFVSPDDMEIEIFKHGVEDGRSAWEAVKHLAEVNP